MKKALFLALVLGTSAVYAATPQTVKPGQENQYTMDPAITDTRLDFDANDGANLSFYVKTTGDQQMDNTNGYKLDNLNTATLNFDLGGTLTVNSGRLGSNWRDGITVNFNMGENGALVTPQEMSMVGYNSKLNLTTTTSMDTLAVGITTRDLITVGNNGSIWFTVNGATTTITLSDASLDAAGFTNVGPLALAADGTYTDLAGNAVTLGLKEYGVLLSRADFALNNAPEKVSLLINAPEPATATLSLLALAGLAARRRRH